MKTKFKNIKTGEVIEIDSEDFELFDKYMSDKNYIIILD